MGACGARGRRRAGGPQRRGGLMARRDSDYDDEIREHIEFETRENLARGMSPSDARAAAQRAFGNSTTVRQLLREGGPWYWLESLGQDFRYGARLLTRNPLLSLS